MPRTDRRDRPAADAAARPKSLTRATLALPLVLLFLTLPSAAFAQGNGPTINAGDTAFVLLSAALVMFMTPGLALFYGGMVRTKNVLGTIMESFVALALVTLVWVFWGYSLAFGPDVGHLIGGLQWLGLRGVDFTPNASYSATVPHQAYMIYQMMFAIITPALISGAVAERMKFSAYCLFMVLWSTLVYCPLAHWVWGDGGWLHNLGALDFAGGTVVHISSGSSALVLALLLGRRRTDDGEQLRPHNLTLTLIGTALLWFGWFGFNAGSAVAANAQAVNAFVVTHIAAATAALSWMVIEWRKFGKPTALGAATGAVAGLVAITPASGFVGPLAAIAIGAVVSLVCYYAVTLKSRFGYDDTLDVFGVHCVGGVWGALATGIFAYVTPQMLPGLSSAATGLLAGNARQLGVQALGVAAALGYAMLMTFIIGSVLDRLMGLRVGPEAETVGLDQSQHGESGYEMFEGAAQ